MNASLNSAFGLFDLFDIFEMSFLGHVFLTLPSKGHCKPAQKSLKTLKTLMKGYIQ